MTDKDVNDAIKIIQTYCREKSECASCPMFINCDRTGAPIYWKYLPEGDKE